MPPQKKTGQDVRTAVEQISLEEENFGEVIALHDSVSKAAQAVEVSDLNVAPKTPIIHNWLPVAYSKFDGKVLALFV